MKRTKDWILNPTFAKASTGRQVQDDKHNFFIAILLASLAIRLIFFIYILDFGDKSWIMVDSEHYHQMTLSITQGNYQTSLSFLRLPGYPAFLAGCYQLLGSYPIYALIIQIALASLIPTLMYFLSLTLFPENLLLAQLTALYSTVHLGFVLYAGMLSTETLFLIFLILFFIFFFRALKKTWILKPTYAKASAGRQVQDDKSKKYLVAKNICIAGLLLGICSLIRPVGHFMLILSCVILWLNNNKLKHMGTLTGYWFLIAGLWLLRNYLLTGYIFFHTLPGQHFLQYSATYVHQDAHSLSYVEARRELIDQYDQEVGTKPKSEIEKCKIAEKIAYKKILEHPLLTLKHSLIHMTKTCIAPQSQLLFYLDNNWHEPQKPSGIVNKIKKFFWPPVHNKLIIPIVYFDLITHLLILLGAFLFCLRMLWQKDLIVIYASLFMSLFVGITLAYGSARLRLPIEPFLIIFAIRFWEDLYKLTKFSTLFTSSSWKRGSSLTFKKMEKKEREK